MTPSEAIDTTLWMLELSGLKGWQVKIVERFTAPHRADKIGCCEVPARTIWLTQEALDRDDTWATIVHECAHALQPIDSEPHGPEFHAALARVRKAIDEWASTPLSVKLERARQRPLSE